MNNETFFWCGAAPTPNRVGDTWFDTDSSWLYRWDGQA